MVLAAGSACGITDEDEVRQVTRDFVIAIIDGKWEHACEVLTDDARRAFERIEGGTSCVRAMELSYRLDEARRRALRANYDFDVIAVRVHDDEAEVRLREALTPDGSVVTYSRREEGDWRIAK
jgi:hypothetical protein